MFVDVYPKENPNMSKCKRNKFEGYWNLNSKIKMFYFKSNKYVNSENVNLGKFNMNGKLNNMLSKVFLGKENENNYSYQFIISIFYYEKCWSWNLEISLIIWDPGIFKRKNNS